jgi:hypothetical protein
MALPGEWSLWQPDAISFRPAAATGGAKSQGIAIMTRFFVAAAAAATLLAAVPAFSQEGGSVFTNNPNELPQFFQGRAPNPADWAGPFFHSQLRPEAPRHPMASRASARDRAVNG